MTGEDEGEVLEVKESPISGSGIARVHTNIIEKNEDLVEGKPALLESESGKRVLRLVADDIIDEKKISLREKDRNKLKVSEGDKVTLSPLKGMDIITKRLASIKK